MSHKAEDIWSPRESYHNHELVSSLSARIFLSGSLLLPLLGLHAFKTLSRYYYEKIVLDDVGCYYSDGNRI